MPSWVIQIDGWDPVAAAAVSICAASEDDDRICHLDAQTWWPAIARLPVLSYDFFSGDFDAGRIETPSGAFVLSVDPFPNLPRYALGGARFRLWSGTPGDAWGSWTLRFDGVVVAQPSISDGLARIDFRVDDRWADSPLLTTYAGSGGSEGVAELLGQPKPLVIGAPRFAGGTMINVTDNIVQLHGYGVIEDVEIAFEAGAQFGASSGDYANYGALLAATIAAGGWATSKAAGLVAFGAPPAGRLSFHVKGDKAGPGGWVQKPGAVINRLALLSGGTGKIASGTMTALDTARPWNVSLAITEQVTARELIQRVAASVNAVAGISWTGKLWVQPVGIGTPTITLAADGSALPPVGRVEQVGIAAPFWRLAIEAENTWQVHSASEVALVDLVPTTTATVYLHKRSATAPTLPSAAITYDFTDGSASGITNGWTQGIPVADGNPLWVTTAFAIDTATTATIASGDWAPVQILAQDGADGTNGTNGTNGTDGLDGADGVDGADGKLVEFVWKRAATLPATPTGNGIPAGWSDDPPAGSDPLWMSKAKQELDGTLIGAWSSPIRHDGPPGTDGADGADGNDGADGATGVSTRTVFQRSATIPSTPAASAGTPSGWYDTTTAVPFGSNPMWSTTGERAAGGTNYTWGTPIRVEAISANSSGRFVNLAFTVSSTIAFALAPGESVIISGAADLPNPTASGFANVQIEWRVAGGGWTASNGPAENYLLGEPVYAEHSVTITNSGTTVQSYETRGTIVRTNTSSGLQNASTSLLRI